MRSGQVLLDGRRRHLGLQVLNESGNMERLDAGKLVEVSLSAPGGKSSGGVRSQSLGRCQKSRPYVQRSVRVANVVTGTYDIYDSLRHLQIRHAKRKANRVLKSPFAGWLLLLQVGILTDV
jgi:hypothetical protein